MLMGCCLLTKQFRRLCVYEAQVPHVSFYRWVSTGDSGVLLERYPCPAFRRMHRSLLWSITWKKRGTWYFQALLLELMALFHVLQHPRERLAIWLAEAWKCQACKDEQWPHWGVCVSSVLGCDCPVFESQLVLMDTLAHIQIYSPISENFIIFQDTLLDVEEEFISS